MCDSVAQEVELSCRASLVALVNPRSAEEEEKEEEV
jgi:hypothetical protein